MYRCATYLCRVPCIPQIEADFQETLGKCRQVSEQTIRTEKLSRKLLGLFCKAIAPLM